MRHSEIPELDKAGLRKFGLTTGAVAASIFGLLLPWLFSFNYPAWPWYLAGSLAIWALIWPNGLRPVYFGWMKVAMVLGFINTHIVLFLLYYLIFFPVALVFKVIGRDPMARKLTSDPEDSYRVASQQRDHKHFERPY